jgi:hypothetical protein
MSSLQRLPRIGNHTDIPVLFSSSAWGCDFKEMLRFVERDYSTASALQRLNIAGKEPSHEM